MNSKIGFIAVGQAGGNIGSKLEAIGHDVLFLNTSDEDLSTLETKFKYHIKGGEGCNKDRNKAKELVIEDFENIAKEILDKVNKDFIYVIFSSGGGTGSGASPMLIDLLIQHMEKAVGAITIIPGENEPLKTHINAYECFRELEEIDGIASTIVLDNNACENKLSINKDFVELLQGMLDMPNHKDVKGNIDKAEVIEMIRSRGMLTITKVDKEQTNLANIVAGLSLPFTRLDQIKNRVVENQESIKRNLQATSETRLKSDINFLDGFTAQAKKPKVGGAADIFAKYKKK